MKEEQQTETAFERLKANAQDDAGNGKHDSEAQIVITLQGGKLSENTTLAETAMIKAGAPLYVRHGEIVRPIIEEVRALKGRRTKTVRLRPVTADMVRDYLSRAVRFEKYDVRAKKAFAVDPPRDIANNLLGRDGLWKFPKLTGVITTPTLREDGSILAAPGYDAATGLLLVDPPPMPAIPERPNRNNALAALALLDGLLDEFPFVDAPSRSVGLSTLMTPVARGAMQVVPMHAADAPEAGSGKSYLFDIASAIASGEIAPAIAAGRDETETEKRLAAELMTGQPIVSIDNLNGELGGDLLCQAIERPIIKSRVLGLSETRRIENTVTLFGNGNNFKVVGDMVRRVVRCSMDANMEQPENRQFKSNPVDAVLANRGCYIAAVLTIVRAYRVAQYPGLLPPLMSFDDWSRLIRSALVWLGRADPVKTMDAARADDPNRSSLRAVVAAWYDVVGVGFDHRLTAGELKEKACSVLDIDGLLNKAFSTVASMRGRNEIDVLRLGKWLGRNKGRVADRLKILGEPDRHSKQMQWWLAELPKQQKGDDK
jgi:putative DNA primase/helicase